MWSQSIKSFFYDKQRHTMNVKYYFTSRIVNRAQFTKLPQESNSRSYDIDTLSLFLFVSTISHPLTNDHIKWWAGYKMLAVTSRKLHQCLICLCLSAVAHLLLIYCSVRLNWIYHSLNIFNYSTAVVFTFKGQSQTGPCTKAANQSTKHVFDTWRKKKQKRTIIK